MTTTKNATLTVNLIEIKWALDENTTLLDQEPEMLILRQPCSYDRDMRSEVDPEATVAALKTVGGCSDEQARQQAASLIARFIAWQEGNYTFVGCIATAYAVVADEDGDEITRIEVASDSVWGIEQDCGEYGPEVEKEQVSILLYSVREAGYDVTDAEWAAVPRKEADDSYSTYPSVTDKETPLDPLTAPEGYTARYAYDYHDVIVEVTCDDCGEVVNSDDYEDMEPHGAWCDKGSEEADDPHAADFLTTKEYGL